MSGQRRHDATSGYWVAGLVFVCAILMGVLVLPRLGKKNQLEGAQAPDFALPVINGRFARPTLRLSDLDGKVTILDFWASWCFPCRQQAPIVESVTKQYETAGVTMVGIATSDQRRAAEAYAKAQPSAYPALFDEDDSVARAYGVQGLPTLVILDKQGRVSALKSGLLQAGELRALVEAALERP